MRLFGLLFVLLAAVTLVAAQWDKDDYEIFELQSALEKDEGEGVNFYSFFNLTKGANADEIRKAYRARSKELHPDKHPGNPTANRRFERLGVINKILRDARRDRYDHFLSNGFPKWRGTGYYYARYRPGLGFVLAFLVLMTAGIELVIKNINYSRDRKRLRTLITTAKVLAWGPRFRSIEAGLMSGDNGQNKNVIVPGEKKVRVPLAGIEVPALAAKKPEEDERVYWDSDEKAVRKAIAASMSAGADGFGPRRNIDALVTREAQVLILDPISNDWIPLDESAAPKPGVSSTWPFSLSRSLLDKVTGSRTQSQAASAVQTEATLSSSNGSSGTAKKPKNKKKQQ